MLGWPRRNYHEVSVYNLENGFPPEQGTSYQMIVTQSSQNGNAIMTAIQYFSLSVCFNSFPEDTGLLMTAIKDFSLSVCINSFLEDTGLLSVH